LLKDDATASFRAADAFPSLLRAAARRWPCSAAFVPGWPRLFRVTRRRMQRRPTRPGRGWSWASLVHGLAAASRSAAAAACAA